MATNPIGKGTKTIGINMNKKMAIAFQEMSWPMIIFVGRGPPRESRST